MVLVQQEVNKPQQSRFVGFSMWQWEWRGRLWDVVSLERFLRQQGTIGTALGFVAFQLSEASGRGQWRTRGNLTARNLIDSCA